MRFGIFRPNFTTKKDAALKPTAEAAPRKPLSRDDYGRIEEAVSYHFKDIAWLQRALTHRSAQHDGGQSDYERLEFLGDAVFDLAVAHLLSDRYPEAREGELSKMRAALVNTMSLAKIASAIGLGPFIRLGRGELSSGGSERPSILADVLEALIGAIYRDSGFDVAFGCVKFLFGAEIEQVTPRDPKTELQEALHAVGSEAPLYMLECVEGPEHAPTFVSVVEVDGEIVGRGRGPTKKASQQLAASEALEKLKLGDDVDRMFYTKLPAAQQSAHGAVMHDETHPDTAAEVSNLIAESSEGQPSSDAADRN